MSKWHNFSKALIFISILSFLWLLLNIFIGGMDNAGIGVIKDTKQLIESLCFFVSPIIEIFQIAGVILYFVLWKKTEDYTLRTIFYELLAISVINLILMCIPGNNLVYYLANKTITGF